jgi:hypothetical protein
MLAIEKDPTRPAPLVPYAGRPELVELWFRLAPRSWTSLALVPADPGGTTSELALSLTEVGKRVDDVTVTAITMDTLDAFSARALGELQRAAEREGTHAPPQGRTVDVEAGPSIFDAGHDADDGPAPPVHRGPAPRATLVLPTAGRVVIAIPSVIEEPLGLAVTQAASLVVIAVVLARTRLASVRRTIELVGRERVAGCVLV